MVIRACSLVVNTHIPGLERPFITTFRLFNLSGNPKLQGQCYAGVTGSCRRGEASCEEKKTRQRLSGHDLFNMVVVHIGVNAVIELSIT